MDKETGTPRNIEAGAFSVDGFCTWAGIGRSAAYEEIKSGRLVAKKRGTRTLIPRENAETWLANLPSTNAAA
jgi:hypothetical protein